MLFRKYHFWQPYYEGEGEGKEGEGKETPPPPDPEAKLFSQKDLDKRINYRFAQEKKEKEKLLSQLEAIKQNGLTPESKEELETQINTLKESLQTKEQTLQQKLDEATKKHSKLLDGVTGERDTWKNRFHKSVIERSILDGAVTAEAENPDQFVMMFSGNSRLEEEVGADGKPTGNFVPKMKFKGMDTETKKLVDMDLPIAEAIAHMREHGLHKNLFKHNATGGTGKPATGGTGKAGDPAKMPAPEDFPDNPEAFNQAFFKWSENYNMDGSPKQKA